MHELNKRWKKEKLGMTLYKDFMCDFCEDTDLTSVELDIFDYHEKKQPAKTASRSSPRQKKLSNITGKNKKGSIAAAAQAKIKKLVTPKLYEECDFIHFFRDVMKNIRNPSYVGNLKDAMWDDLVEKGVKCASSDFDAAVESFVNAGKAIVITNDNDL